MKSEYSLFLGAGNQFDCLSERASRLVRRSFAEGDWRKSIVDLMKLVGIDSSLAARKQLAAELRYSGDEKDSAAMNIWLHKEVIKKIAENGGKVPKELLIRTRDRGTL
jgi:hypothetical protein